METEFLFEELDWVWDFAHNVNRTLLAQNDQGESRISKVYFFYVKLQMSKKTSCPAGLSQLSPVAMVLLLENIITQI